ncbi:MAG: aldo/keto reductase [Actinomycetaceae bacterium]|nr:aldo/keto reductase [Actinomycetaceae bacterium]
MQHRYMGNTGLSVSCLGLGTLTWGRDTTITEAEAICKAYRDAGGNVIDTSPSYGDGDAERVVGELINSSIDRSEIVLMTKGGYFCSADTRRLSHSRNAILQSIDRSLNRCQTDYIDVFFLQFSDPHTPIEETLSTLELALRSGRVRYVGVSNFSAWNTAEAFYRGANLGVPVQAVQAEYSLLERGIERELTPALESQGLGLFAWSALARGVLTGKYRHSTPADSRGASPVFAEFVEPHLTPQAQQIVEAVAKAAEGLDASALEVALGWLLQQPAVTCGLVGPRTLTHMRQMIDALRFELPAPIAQALTEVSQLHRGYPETSAMDDDV